MTSRPETSIRTTSLESNPIVQMADKQNLPDPAQGIIRRTRTALGDIGNRLQVKEALGNNGTMEKRGPLIGKQTTSGLRAGLKKNGSTANKSSRAITQVARTNSMQVIGNGNAIRQISENGRVLISARSKLSSAVATAAAPTAALVKIEEGFIESKLEKPSTLVERGSTAIKVEVSSAVPQVDSERLESLEIESLSKAFSLQRFADCEIKDIDANDVGEFMLKEYAKDIDQYLHKLEKDYPIREDFLKDRSVNSRMRAVLLDWIVDVHHQFALCQETLYLAGRILDRFLQLDKAISRNQLQLAGVTALFIAVKFEEVCVPTIVDFSSVSDNAFSPEDVRNMEARVLKTLKFDLACPIPTAFLRRYSKALKMDVNSYMLSKYIVELSILEYNLSHIYPSMISAASIALATMVVNTVPIQTAWTESVTYYCRYTLAELKPVLTVLINTLSRPYLEKEQSRFNASVKKYARSKLMRISSFTVLQSASWKARVLAEVEKF